MTPLHLLTLALAFIFTSLPTDLAYKTANVTYGPATLMNHHPCPRGVNIPYNPLGTAISISDSNGNDQANCGKHIQVWYSGLTVTVTVQGTCMDCPPGTLVFWPAPFLQLAPPQPGLPPASAIAADWDFVACWGSDSRRVWLCR